jgi:hypothetical protein
MSADNNNQNPALGGDMSWKKVVFLGGAAFLLAACSESATAPTALVRDGGHSAAAKAAPRPKAGATSTPSGCESGYFVQWGVDSTCSAPEAP